MERIEIIDTNADNILEYGVCGYKNIKRAGYPEKIEWLKDRFSEGMKIKTLYSDEDGTQGMIEYIPGEYCWRPVEASGYMFIHCIFVGFKKAYKGKGYGSLLVDECLKDARKENMHGVAVVTRKGPFMAGKELFVKNSFEVVDKAPPDFELLVKKFNKNAATPKFKGDWRKRRSQYGKGLTIIRADQCPYTVKNVKEISETAEKILGIKPIIIDLKNCEEAQNSPCAFGSFCILYNGKVIANHPISKNRFANIMKTKSKSNGNKGSKIPKTGKIGSLAKNIEKEINRDVVLEIMHDVGQFKSASSRVEKAEWIKGAIERLEQQVGKETSIKIMENCGRDCCGPKHSEHAKQLMSESKSVEEFAGKLSRGGVKFKLKDGNTIIGEYSKCYCSLVNQAPKPFSSNVYCHCGAGYIKQQFESAFGKPIEVELVQSVITGAESCKFLIHL